MFVKNTNNLSNCTYNHTPKSGECAEAYRAIQEKIIRKNAIRSVGPFSETQPVSHLAQYIPHDVDRYFVNDDDFSKIAGELAKIRIADANISHSKS